MRISELDGKAIAVWGLGREGTSVLNYLQKHGIGKEIRVFENDGEVDLSGVDIVICFWAKCGAGSRNVRLSASAVPKAKAPVSALWRI